MKTVLKEPVTLLFIGFIVGLSAAAMCVEGMVHKSTIREGMVYIDERVFRIKEIK